MITYREGVYIGEHEMGTMYLCALEKQGYFFVREDKIDPTLRAFWFWGENQDSVSRFKDAKLLIPKEFTLW